MFQRKSIAEIAQLAIDIHAGKVFTDRDARSPEDVSMMFMVLRFVDQETLDMLKSGIVGMLYEYISEAMPRACNGLPCFMSVRFLHKDDVPLLESKLNEVVVALDSIKKA